MPRNNIMVFSLARGGTTLLSLILGANKSVTNFGESHWIFKGSNKVDNSCRAHGEACTVISDLIKKGINYGNHFKTLMSASSTPHIMTTNKHFGHYKKMDYKLFNNKIILMYKPPEMWFGSFLGKNKIPLPKDRDKALAHLLDMHSSFYLENIKLIKKNKHLNDYIIVNYRDLAEKTEETIRGISKFLEIDYSDEMLRFNTYLMSDHPDQHPIGGNIRTYYNLNNGRDARYSSNIDSIYVESKYKNKLTKKEIDTILSSNKYITTRKNLGL